MNLSVLRIAALCLLIIPGARAADSPDGADVPDVDPNLPNAAAVGLFCGHIVRHETSAFSKVIFKNLEITVDDGYNINVAEKGVLVGQIKSAEYSTFGQCLYATLGAMRQYAK